MTHPPLIERLANDPILKECKLIAEAWDAGGMYQVGSFNASNRWSEWNDKYRDCIRDYMKGDFWRAPEALQRITGSRDIFGNKNAEALSTVNFITCHDGFTLMDLFSYNTKHNEANGYDNRDGIDDNHSWNCGVEGETDDKKVIDLRMRLIRNSVVTLMLSRGIPMILMGDEIGRTKKGNNNTFCQDNEISWMNWNLVEENEELFNFWRNVISFRKKHPSISRNLEPSATNYPYISTHAADPARTEVTSDDRVCGVMYAGRKKDGEEDIVFLAINVHWEYNKIKLPPLPGGYRWALAINTADSDDYWFYDMPVPIGSDEYEMNYRSIAVFVAICS
jgi:glycogen operon protein